MDKNKATTTTTTTTKTTTPSGSIDELVRLINNNHNSTTRTSSPPLVNTSIRATKHRVDNDIGPIRIEGTDTYNQPISHLYQNVRQVAEDQTLNEITNKDPALESRQSFSAKRDYFEQRFKTSPSTTYDSPPRQRIITTITTTTTSKPTKRDHSRSSTKESSPSIERLFEQTSELQKLTSIKSDKIDSPQPLVVERTQQYQVFLNPTAQEVRRTRTISPIRTNYATDLDQAQAQIDHAADDHQAIQELTRVLKEHNGTAINEYKRLPSPSNPILINTTTTTTTTIPSNIIFIDQTNVPETSEHAVIDALLENPLGTYDNQQNQQVHKCFNTIRTKLQDVEYVKSLKEAVEKNNKKMKKKKKGSTIKGPAVDKETQLTETMIDSIVLSSEHTLSPSSKAKKKLKSKSKKLSKTTDYQVIDAIINSPISLRLPDTYLNKYKVHRAPSQLSSSSPLSVLKANNNLSSSQQFDRKANNKTDTGLVKTVNEKMIDHRPTLTTLATTKSVKSTTSNQIISPPRLVTNSNQFSTKTSSEPIQPRIVYRYLDEQGNVLKISSIPPSQLREYNHDKVQQRSEPTLFHSRRIVIDDPHHHPISERDQRNTWKDDSKFPITLKREVLESQDKPKLQLSPRPSSTPRPLPISFEREQSIRSPSQQHIYHFPNQNHVKLNWTPLVDPSEVQYKSSVKPGYDTDSTSSDHSLTYNTYDYAPPSDHHRYTNRPLLQHSHLSPGRNNHPSPTLALYDSRGMLSEYDRNGSPRNYIEIFRDGETRPSEVYSLPLEEPIRNNNNNNRHSRYDRYQSEKSGKHSHSSSRPHSQHDKVISLFSSLPQNDRIYSHSNQSSPNHDQSYLENYSHRKKSSDYRPLRTKLQREYKITPSLLVDEWDHPGHSTSTSFRTQTSIQSPDEVFLINNRTNKA